MDGRGLAARRERGLGRASHVAQARSIPRRHGRLRCGHRTRFVLAADLVNDLVASQAKNTLHRRLAAYAAPELLIIDELGYLSFDARGADLL